MIGRSDAVAVIGAGHVGASVANALVLLGVTDRVVLYDRRLASAEGEAWDIADGVPLLGNAQVTATDDWEQVGDAGAQHPVRDRPHRSDTPAPAWSRSRRASDAGALGRSPGARIPRPGCHRHDGSRLTSRWPRWRLTAGRALAVRGSDQPAAGSAIPLQLCTAIAGRRACANRASSGTSRSSAGPTPARAV